MRFLSLRAFVVQMPGGSLELYTDLEHALEPARLLLSREALHFVALAGQQGDGELPAVQCTAEVLHRIRVAAVQPVHKAEDSAELRDELLVVRRERGERRVVRRVRRAAAMVTGDVRDERLAVRGEAGDGMLRDEAERSLVVLLVPCDVADVVQQGRRTTSARGRSSPDGGLDVGQRVQSEQHGLIEQPQRQPPSSWNEWPLEAVGRRNRMIFVGSMTAPPFTPRRSTFG